MDAMKCGQFIVKRRKELQITQKELATQIHVTDKAVSRWERGKGFPDIQLLEPLANALKISITELLNAECMDMSQVNDTSIKDVVHLAHQEKESMKRKYLRYFFIPIFIITILCISFLVYFFSGQFFGLWILAGILSFGFLLLNFLCIIKNRFRYSSLLCILSVSLFSFVILEEYRLTSIWLNQNDIVALLDVVPTLAKGLSFLFCMNIFLNFILYMISEIKNKR